MLCFPPPTMSRAEALHPGEMCHSLLPYLRRIIKPQQMDFE